jgi:hypothetical protein
LLYFLLHFMRSRISNDATYHEFLFALNLLKDPRKWGEFICRLSLRVIRLFKPKMGDINQHHCDG